MAYDLVPLGAIGCMQHHTPSHICKMVQSGNVDAALLPVACLDNVTQKYETLGNFGISCRGDVGSVLMFCRLPLETIAEKRLPIYITPHSRTSVALFQYLYQRRFGSTPVLTEEQCSAYAHMYIGNESLDFAQSRNHSVEVIDLSGWWYKETGYPFVFARWVVRRDVLVEAKEQLLQWQNESTAMATSEAGHELMVLNNQSQFASLEEAHAYYHQLEFSLGEDELVGLNLFQTSLRKLKLCNPAA